jgi:hypothetical protein
MSTPVAAAHRRPLTCVVVSDACLPAPNTLLGHNAAPAVREAWPERPWSLPPDAFDSVWPCVAVDGDAFTLMVPVLTGDYCPLLGLRSEPGGAHSHSARIPAVHALRVSRLLFSFYVPFTAPALGTIRELLRCRKRVSTVWTPANTLHREARSGGAIYLLSYSSGTFSAQGHCSWPARRCAWVSAGCG